MEVTRPDLIDEVLESIILLSEATRSTALGDLSFLIINLGGTSRPASACWCCGGTPWAKPTGC